MQEKMKLRDLFKPKLLEARVKTRSSEEGLVYAVNHTLGSSSIYLYMNGKKDIHLCDRWHAITSLCIHNNWLYDGGYKSVKFPSYEPNETLGFVIDTITGKDVMERKNNPVHTLCSHNGKLYRGDDRGGIYEVSPVKLVAVRFGKVTTLCSHEGILYDGGCYKGVHDTFKDDVGNKKVNNKKKYVPYLCSDKNVLYGVSPKFDEDFYFSGFIFDVLKNKKIKNIEETPILICSYRDELYYAYRGIVKKLSDDSILIHEKNTATDTISAMCSIPSELEEQILHVKNYGFDFNKVQQINPKGAIEYLANIIDYQERRRVIEQLFNYDQVHEDVIDWLNENEKDIMRKAAFY